MTSNTLIYILIWGCVWGVICQAVGSSKNIKGCFWWGFLLGLIGLIIVACMHGKENVTEVKVINPNETKTDKYEQLEKLSRLRDAGTITEEEFVEEKEKILKQ